ncbi:MAG: tetratricopeptide repeat protein [Pirellulales bacterium]|nr:tetratricopeptide repeat protein [Pirellulales bacterium]
MSGKFWLTFLICVFPGTPLLADDLWIGKRVFWRDDAIAKIGNQVFDVTLIPYPATVEHVNGEWLWLERAWVRKKDVMDVIGAFSMANTRISINYAPAEALRIRAATWIAWGNYDKAYSDIQLAILHHPKDAFNYLYRGNLNFERKDYNKAITDYDIAIGINPDLSKAYRDRGFAKNMLQDYAGALRDLNEAIRLDSKDYLSYFNRGYVHDDMGNHDRAIKDFDNAIQLHPYYYLSFYNRGISKQSKQELNAAIKDYDVAIRLNPKYAPAYNNRGQAKMLQTDFHGAIQDFDASIQLEPSNANIYIIRSYAFTQIKHYDEAIRDANKAIRIDPSLSLAFEYRAGSKLYINDYSGSIQDYCEVIKRDPKDSKACYRLGIAYHCNRDYVSALNNFNKSINLDANSVMPSACKSFLLATCPQPEFRDGPLALELAESALKQANKDGYALNAKACALALLGKYDEAITCQELAKLDNDWRSDELPSGGKLAEERIAAWKSKKLWLSEPPARDKK